MKLTIDGLELIRTLFNKFLQGDKITKWKITKSQTAATIQSIELLCSNGQLYGRTIKERIEKETEENEEHGWFRAGVILLMLWPAASIMILVWCSWQTI